MDTTDSSTRLTRRRVLGVSAVAIATAGCLGTSEEDSSGGTQTQTATPVSGTETSTDAPQGPTPTTTDGQLPPAVAGDPDADVTLEVYTDYACPHCANFALQGFPEIESKYVEDGTIRYEHRDLPLPVADPGSWVAASAAREVQSRYGAEAFFEYAEAIFENSRELGSNPGDLMARLADEQGLGSEAIRTAGVELANEETVRGDRQRGIELGVQGTPAFVVNEEVITAGYQSSTVGTISDAIDERL
jgi:protein-disulfide isomerase